MGALLDGAPTLRDLQGNDLGLVEVLDAAHVPYERALGLRREREQAAREEQERLLGDPGALREHLHRCENLLRSYTESLGAPGAQAVGLLLGSTAPLDPQERAVLRAVARDLDDALLEPGMSLLSAPGAAVAGEVALLCEYYRTAQSKVIEALADRHGQGPSLRQAERVLREGRLLERGTIDQLPASVKRDCAGRENQARLRHAYLEWREQAARRLARHAGGLGRLTHPTSDFYPRLDRERLKLCGHCEELVYPAAGEDRRLADEQPLLCCHYCGESYELRQYTPRPATDHDSKGWSSQP